MGLELHGMGLELHDNGLELSMSMMLIWGCMDLLQLHTWYIL
jgi:hypothetical protein